MSLHLDARQRAMLQEMGVHVWSPAPQPAPVPELAAAAPSPAAVSPPASVPIAPQHPTRTAIFTAAPVTAETQASPGLVLHPPQRLFLDADAQQTPVSLGHAWLILAEGRAGVDPLADDAGALLHNMLRALQLHRHPRVFFCGVELAAEGQPNHSDASAPILAQALAEIQPAMVLLMGRLAARVALGRTEPLGQLRAQPHSVSGHPAIVTYEAPYLLRQGKFKAAAWADLCHARALVQASRKP